MAEYIEREKAMFAILKNPPDAHYPEWYARDIREIPAADVVKVEDVKAWLFEIAKNNTGVIIDGDFSKACEEIISRLDGLRIFAKEMEDHKNA